MKLFRKSQKMNMAGLVLRPSPEQTWSVLPRIAHSALAMSAPETERKHRAQAVAPSNDYHRTFVLLYSHLVIAMKFSLRLLFLLAYMRAMDPIQPYTSWSTMILQLIADLFLPVADPRVDPHSHGITYRLIFPNMQLWTLTKSEEIRAVQVYIRSTRMKTRTTSRCRLRNNLQSNQYLRITHLGRDCSTSLEPMKFNQAQGGSVDFSSLACYIYLSNYYQHGQSVNAKGSTQSVQPI